MSRRIAALLAGTLILAVASFLVTRALRSDSAAPLSETVEANSVDGSIGVAFPTVITGDVWDTAIETGAAERARREAASAAGEVIEDSTVLLDPASGYSFPEIFEFDWGEVYSFGDDEVDPPESDGSGVGPVPGEDPAADGAVDACTAEDPPGDCPDGVAGTVLAIRSLPPLGGTVKVDPFAPGTAPYNFWAECPGVEPAPGRISIGVAANRPADVHLGWWLSSPFRSPPVEPEETMVVSTTDAQAAVWTSWVEDESAGYEDPRYWIDHCIVLEGIAPGHYRLEATLVDRLPSGDVYRFPTLFGFSVPDETGEVPIQQRRPTALLPWGIDRLYVAATRTRDQQLVVRALDVDVGSTCDTGGDPTRVLVPEEGATDAAFLGETVIPESRRFDRDYPYLPLHSIDAAYVLDLEEGTDYLLCLYWILGEGRSIDIVEEIPVSTPDAYTPRVILHGVDDLIISGLDFDVAVEASGCWAPQRVTVEIGDHPGPVMIEPRSVCDFDRGLSAVEARNGFFVVTSLVLDGERHERRSGVRTGPLECRFSPCLLRLDEMVRVPFPEIATERRLCGSGWGSGCSDPVPVRTAGYAVLQIVYDRSRSNGIAGWALGAPEESPDTTPTQPRVTVTASSAPIGNVAFDGMQVSVTVQADRPVTLTAEVIDGIEGRESCFIAGPPAPFSTTEPQALHSFTVAGLCVGELYGLQLTGVDAAGEELVVLISPRTPVSNVRRMWLPTAGVTMTNDVTVALPDDGYHHTVSASMGGVGVPRLNDLGVGGGGLSVGGAECLPPSTGSATLTGISFAVANQVDLQISADVLVRRNIPRSSTVFTDCAPFEDVASYHLEATVSLADLATGVTLTSEDGVVTYRIQATSVLGSRAAV